MTSQHDLDRLLGSWMEADGPQDVPARVVQRAFRDARRVKQQSLLRSALLGWPSRWGAATLARRRSGGLPRLVAVLLALVLLALLAAGGLLVGGQLLGPRLDTSMPSCGEVLCPLEPLTDARSFHTATDLGEEQILVVGGFDENADDRSRASTCRPRSGIPPR